MAEPKLTWQQEANQKSTKLNIELTAELSTIGGKSGQSAVDASHERERMEELVRANPDAARKALAELQQSLVHPDGVSQDAQWIEKQGGNTKEAIAAIEKALEKELLHNKATRQGMTVADIELAAESSTAAGQDTQARDREIRKMDDLVRANPDAARQALAELQQKEIKPGVSTDAHWKEEVGGNTKEAIAALRESLKDAGISGAKDVHAHEVRHDTSTVPQQRYLGG